MRFKPRFSLRLLLLLPLLAAVPLALRYDRQYRRQRAIAVLTASGATVYVADSQSRYGSSWFGKGFAEYVLGVSSRGRRQSVSSQRVGAVDRYFSGRPTDQPLSDGEALHCVGRDAPDPTVRLTDADMAHVGQFGDCRVLNLPGTTISDDGLAYLSGLHRLELLVLCDTPITDAGLVHLRSLKSLEFVHLNGTRVTAAGVARLEQAIPGIRVIW